MSETTQVEREFADIDPAEIVDIDNPKPGQITRRSIDFEPFVEEIIVHPPSEWGKPE